MEHTLLQSHLLWGEFSICALCCSYSQSLQFSFLVPPGTHHCWVDRGGVIWKACPTPLHMAGSVTRAAVTHPSTNRARRCLTSAIWRELVTIRPCATKQHNPNPVSHQTDKTIQVRSYSRKGEMAGWIGMYISCLKMLHLPLIYLKMSPLRVTKGVCEAIHTHANPWGRLKWPYNQTTDRPLYVIGLLDLTCLTETMQTSLNITKPQTLNPNRTSKHCEVLNC